MTRMGRAALPPDIAQEVQCAAHPRHPRNPRLYPLSVLSVFGMVVKMFARLYNAGTLNPFNGKCQHAAKA